MKALDKLLGGQQNLIGIVLLALLILVVFPLTLDAFRLNMVGKYLTYAFVAVGLVLCWGYGGILSLGQGVFFGVGGYCMAMFLKLEASDPQSTKIQSTPGIPDFMDWNQITELPWLWQPFHSFGFTVVAVVAVPVLLFSQRPAAGPALVSPVSSIVSPESARRLSQSTRGLPTQRRPFTQVVVSCLPRWSPCSACRLRRGGSRVCSVFC